MVKKIVLVIACLFLYTFIHAQNQHLAWFFNHYANEDKFSYVNMEDGYTEIKVDSNIVKEFIEVKFVKVLSYNGDMKSRQAKKFLKGLKGNFFNHKLVLNTTDESGNKTIIYMKKTDQYICVTEETEWETIKCQKKTDNVMLDKTIIKENKSEISVTWIYGKIQEAEKNNSDNNKVVEQIND